MNNLGAQFFDIFGVIAFIYVIFVAHNLLKGRKLRKGFITLLLLVGLGGLVVDALIVSSYYLVR